MAVALVVVVAVVLTGFGIAWLAIPLHSNTYTVYFGIPSSQGALQLLAARLRTVPGVRTVDVESSDEALNSLSSYADQHEAESSTWLMGPSLRGAVRIEMVPMVGWMFNAKVMRVIDNDAVAAGLLRELRPSTGGALPD